jgi:hypothetical protein
MIAERCPNCGLRFERIEGHWIGAIGINTVATFALILFLLIASLIIFINSDVPRWYIAVGLVVVGGGIPPLIDPFTRTFWTAIDIAMRPLEPFEVDWQVVDPYAVSRAPIPSHHDGNTFAPDALSSSGTDEPLSKPETDPNEDP